MVAIYLRAGWSVGKVQDQYIFSGAGSDQVVGRAAAGLPINDNGFAVLPPHFFARGTVILREIGDSNIYESYDYFPE